jgi:hypothetical protein
LHSNLFLDKLDQFVAQMFLLTFHQDERRKTNPPYVAITKAAWQARKAGDRRASPTLSHRFESVDMHLSLEGQVFQKKEYINSNKI